MNAEAIRTQGHKTARRHITAFKHKKAIPFVEYTRGDIFPGAIFKLLYLTKIYVINIIHKK